MKLYHPNTNMWSHVSLWKDLLTSPPLLSVLICYFASFLTSWFFFSRPISLYAFSFSLPFLFLFSPLFAPLPSGHSFPEGAVLAGDGGRRRAAPPPRSLHGAGRDLPSWGRGRRMEGDSQVLSGPTRASAGVMWPMLQPITVWLSLFSTSLSHAGYPCALFIYLRVPDWQGVNK